VPIGALTHQEDGQLLLRGTVLPPDGTMRIEAAIKGKMEDATGLGKQLAETLMEKGARKLLAS